MIALCYAAALACSPLLIIPTLTASLALVTSLRRRLRARGRRADDDDDDEKEEKEKKDDKSRWSRYRTSIYSGRVSHARYLPVPHSFSYPLFFFCVDLSEVGELFLGGGAALWPLSLLMQFRDIDHLRNGEGASNTEGGDNSLHSRIRHLVDERTGGGCSPPPSSTVLLLTHLRYFGYCFNPVSFYYVLRKGDDDGGGGADDGGGGRRERRGEEEIEAVVAEVGNTPWGEMRCYVLHPDSVDVDSVRPGRTRRRDDDEAAAGCGDADFPSDSKDGDGDRNGGGGEGGWRSVNYSFRKAFHVSPFMDMDHTYDWTLWTPRRDRIAASTAMIKGDDKFFDAYFDVRRRRFHPLELCLQLIRLPAYCVIVQVWIHVEAFRVFLKGVEFVPHPEGTETAASRIIGRAMAPFFAVKGWIQRRGSSGGSGKATKVE